MSTIILTGAAGVIGSATLVALVDRGDQVIAIDQREPGPELRARTPDAHWLIGDYADTAILDAVAPLLGDEQPVLIHLAAHYDFGTRWHDRYQHSNVDGIDRLITACRRWQVDRVLFASSLAVHEPPAPGTTLSEATPPDATMPYGRSKILGEERWRASGLPTAIIRIGGVFTGWCELPPLCSLLRQWAGPWPLRSVVVGQGASAIPYIDRRDMVALLLRLSDPARPWRETQVCYACDETATSHAELFHAIANRTPTSLPLWLARLGLAGRNTLAACIGADCFERLWMLRYVDQPMTVDITGTHEVTGWACRPERSILVQLPAMMARLKNNRHTWLQRNRHRNQATYCWTDDP